MEASNSFVKPESPAEGFARKKILSSQADLAPTARAMIEMHDWCQLHNDVVVLQDGTILAQDPASRHVQNCKIVMLNKGIRPGKVLTAAIDLIGMLLANVTDQNTDVDASSDRGAFSVQQQRLRMLVRDAVNAQASDIHIEVREEVARIYFRKHGELYLHAEWLSRLGREIAAVAFNKETDYATTHFNPHVPQNASMPLQVDNTEVRLRLANMPAHGGFDMVMRVLTAGQEYAPSLLELGYTPAQIELIMRAIHMPHGAVIVAGPTGSGKTTTLASCMEMIEPGRKVYTIEDPVEKIISNATQVPVNTEKDDRDFASMGRAALRMDPDVIVLGEMRDEDTAKVMVRAAITGHLVFSTLHTNSATAIVTRLADMGISPVLLGDTNLLVCLICQRLIQKLCEACSIPLAESNYHQKYLSRWREVLHADWQHLRARGQRPCKKCHGTGVSGRAVVAEIIWVDDQGRSFIQKGDTLGWENYLKGNGWSNYREHALELIRAGVCDPLDAEKIIGEINVDISHSCYDYRQKGI